MKSASEPSSLDAHLGFWLRFVSNHVSHAFQRKVEAHGVTVAEWVVLRELFSLEATSPGSLADSLGMTRGAISKLADRLLAKKLLSRSPGRDDRRFQTVKLTPAGRKLVPVLAALADRNDEEFFGHFSPSERAALKDLLVDLVRRHELRNIPVE
jgi:DNA-binding MarR family transcriptional regulator